eukprot:scaffold812_cov19-Tisochrysis_lutea.AAC.1
MYVATPTQPSYGIKLHIRPPICSSTTMHFAAPTQPSYDIKLQIRDPLPEDNSWHSPSPLSKPDSHAPKPAAQSLGGESPGCLRVHADWCAWWREQLCQSPAASKAQAQQTLLALAQVSATSSIAGTSSGASTLPQVLTSNSREPMAFSNSSSSSVCCSSTSSGSPFLASLAPRLVRALPLLSPHALVQAAEALATLQQGASSSSLDFQSQQNDSAAKSPLPQHHTGKVEGSMLPTAVENTLSVLGGDPAAQQQQWQQQQLEQEQQRQQLELVRQQEQEQVSGTSCEDSSSVCMLVVVEAIMEACEQHMGAMTAQQ